MRFHLLIPLLSFFSSTSLLAQIVPLRSSLSEEQINQKRTQYQEQLHQLEEFRVKQLNKYKAGPTSEKQKILAEVKIRLEKELTEHVFPAWYGTPWDFSGTSNEPGKGKIACGYFVSTTLKHIGFKLNRYKLAQQASQRIITTFLKSSALDISSQRSLADVKKKLMASGNGIYIVGLDSHVGYIVVQDEKITFVHSSYYSPDRQVVAEPYDSKNPLSDSKYRVSGKLFDDEMLINWLYAKPYTVAQ